MTFLIYKRSSPPFTPAPRSAYSFDALTSSQFADVGGGGFPITITGSGVSVVSTPFIAGSGSGSFGGTGTSFLASASSSALPIGNVFTIAGWFQLTTTAGVAGIFSQDTSGQDFSLLNNAGALQFYYSSGPNVGMGSLSIDTWYHVAITLNGGSGTCYLQGSSVGAYSGSSGPARGNLLQFAHDPTFGNRRMAGFLDEWGIWSSVLSASDITSLYNRGIAGTSMI